MKRRLTKEHKSKISEALKNKKKSKEHIKKLSKSIKKNNQPNNLISLCKSCHSQTNWKRNDWINYFKKKVIVNA